MKINSKDNKKLLFEMMQKVNPDFKIINEEVYNEGYKWKPSASQRREFAQRMQNPEEKAAYEKRKEDKLNNKRAGSKFDYNSAGGNYVPTKNQYDFVMNHMDLFNTDEESDAANQIMFGYVNNEKVHHDNIHIVNEKIRNFK